VGDREALVRAVLAAPADDLRRLVWADWLDEHEEAERATYVRAQVELASLVAAEQFDADEYVEAVRAVASVSRESLWQWAAADGLPVTTGDLLSRDTVGDVDRVRDVTGELTYGYRRGLVEEVRCRSTFWIERGKRVVARTPVGRVELLDRKPVNPVRGEWVWRSSEGGPGDSSNILPRVIFERLPEVNGFVAIYRTRKAASDVLSEACLAYAHAR
jgi:uncharacterized protein (TIGR02996 family)